MENSRCRETVGAHLKEEKDGKLVLTLILLKTLSTIRKKLGQE